MNKSKTLNWQNVWGEFSNNSDRAIATIAAEILNRSLFTLLSNYLVSDPEEISKLLDERGSLSYLYGKANIAFCLGLITRRQLEDLRAINTIRNHFAHRLDALSFSDEPIRESMKQIEQYKSFMNSSDADSSRKLFHAAVGMLAYTLTVEADRVEHRQEMKPMKPTFLFGK